MASPVRIFNYSAYPIKLFSRAVMDFNTSNDEVHLPALKSFPPFCYQAHQAPVGLTDAMETFGEDGRREREGGKGERGGDFRPRRRRPFRSRRGQNVNVG